MIAEIAASAGLDTTTTREATGIVIGFLDRAGPQPKVQGLIDKMPGARQLASESGGTATGLLGVFNELSGVGLGFGDVERLARAFVTAARKRVGDTEVDDVVRSVPGLSQFI